MKTIKLFMIGLGVMLLPFLTYANSISSTELEKQTKEGNILSDSFNSLSECSTTKDRYNREFSSYKRSECFLHNNKYHYFICQLSNSCNVNLSASSGVTTSSTSISNVPNQDKLDTFLTKVKNMRNELNNDSRFESVLNQLLSQLKTLGDRYSSNNTISQMVSYLNNGVLAIKNDLTQNKDVDDFFCELLGTCGNDTPPEVKCPVVMPPVCPNGQESYIKEYNTSIQGCNIPVFDCKIISTTTPQFEHKNSVTGKSQEIYYEGEKLHLYSSNIGRNVIGCMEKVGDQRTSCSHQSNWIPLPSPWYYSNNSWKLDNYHFFEHYGVGTFLGYHKDLDTGLTVITEIKVGAKANSNMGKECQLSNRYYYNEKGQYNKYLTRQQVRDLGPLSQRHCPSLPNGEEFLFAQYKLDDNYYFSEGRKLPEGDKGYDIKANYLTCASQVKGVLDANGKCVAKGTVLTTPNTTTTTSTTYNNTTNTTSNSQTSFEHKNSVTGETQTTYYANDRINLYSSNIGRNVIGCMEKVGVASSSCNIQSNWISLPQPRYYSNNSWKLDNYDFFRNHGAGKFIGYHKDLDTGKTLKTEFSVVNQNRPAYFRTNNITYKGNLKLDVYRPANVSTTQKVPVVLIVHGGGWIMESKDSPVMVEFGKYFYQNGMAYVPINYTLATASSPSYDKVYREIDCALQWVHAHKDKYHFDTNNITLGGGSAGAHLALQYALNQSSYRDTSCSWGVINPKFQKVLAVATPTDLTKDFSNTDMGNINYMVEYFLGLKRNNTSFMQRARENSPINFVNKDNKNLKYYMVHGTSDQLVRYNEHAVPMFNALKNNGYNVVMDTNMSGHDGNSIRSSQMIQFLKN